MHLASDDQGQNEAERTNAYIGEAIADGCPLKIDYYDKHHGLSEEDVKSMSLKDLKYFEESMKEKNAWCIAEEVRVRIDDEPGPGQSFMQSLLTEKKVLQFFHNSNYLNAWRKAGKRVKSTLPGHNYFNMTEMQMKSHCDIGELFYEFQRFKCNSEECSLCGKSQDMPFQVIDPFPRPVPESDAGHYKTYENTSSYQENGQLRIPDDFQPRKQCEILFNEGRIDTKNSEALNGFCTKYLAEKSLVVEFLMHKEDLKLGKQKRKQD